MEALEFTRMNKVKSAAKEWISDHCDSKGNQSNTNFNNTQRAAVNKLKKRVENGEVVIMPTDKSSKHAIMSLATYESMGSVHTANDPSVDEQELSKIQRDLNNYT